MSQIIINVGSTSNDHTGDTLRGAFINVNANFTEVYDQFSGINAIASNAYDQANAANVLAYNTSINANNVGINANNWSNSYAIAIGVSSNNYAGYVGNSVNSVVSTTGASANLYSNKVGAAGNAVITIGLASANAWSNSLAALGTSYVNDALTADRAYNNTSFAAANNWANATFQTLSNGTAAYATANQALGLAATALQNTTTTLAGSFTAQGFVSDFLGSVREKRTVTINSNSSIQAAETIIIANNSGSIYLSLDNDGNFLYSANIGAKIEIHQFGAGQTTIRANDAFVNVFSANNWANVAGQYMTVNLIKIRANTWMLTGDLKA